LMVGSPIWRNTMKEISETASSTKTDWPSLRSRWTSMLLLRVLVELHVLEVHHVVRVHGNVDGFDGREMDDLVMQRDVETIFLHHIPDLLDGGVALAHIAF